MSGLAVAITPVATEVVQIPCCTEHGPRTKSDPCDVCGARVQFVPMVPVKITQGAPCACGCRRPQTGDSAYHEDACRTRHWKEQTGYVDPRRAAAANGANGSQLRLLRPPRPSGRQLSYRRAVRAVAAYLVGARIIVNPAEAEKVAENILRRVLPARQRTTRTRRSS